MFNLFGSKPNKPLPGEVEPLNGYAKPAPPAPMHIPDSEQQLQPKQCWSVRWLSGRSGSRDNVLHCEFFDEERPARALEQSLKAAYKLLRYDPSVCFYSHKEFKTLDIPVICKRER